MNDKEKDKVDGHFVSCIKPVFNSDDKVEDWFPSFVRLSEIKTVHRCKDNIRCVFFTYKDEWYRCKMPIDELIEGINNSVMPLKGFSHAEKPKSRVQRKRHKVPD